MSHMITELRRARNLTAPELAPRIGISRSALQNIECGTHRLPTRAAWRAAQFFGISPSRFQCAHCEQPLCEMPTLVDNREALVDARRSRGFTQLGLAQRVPMSQQYVAALERKPYFGSAGIWCRLAETLGVTDGTFRCWDCGQSTKR